MGIKIHSSEIASKSLIFIVTGLGFTVALYSDGDVELLTNTLVLSIVTVSWLWSLNKLTGGWLEQKFKRPEHNHRDAHE